MKLACVCLLVVFTVMAVPRQPINKAERKRALHASGVLASNRRPVARKDMDLNGDGKVTGQEIEKWFRINRVIKSFE